LEDNLPELRLDDSNLPDPHSGFGIASFVISLLAGLVLVAVIGVAGVLETSDPGAFDEDTPEAVAIGLGMIGGIFADLLALGLGIAGLVQNYRNKTYAILGTVISAVSISMVSVFVIMGAFIEA